MDSIALSLTLIGFGVVLIVLSYQRHRHHRDVSAVGHGISGAVLAISGLAWLTMTWNFTTYEPFTPEQPLAELTLERAGPNTFNARLLRIPAGDLQVFVLQGDHWRMTATLLDWHGWTQWLGLRSNLRLENLSSTMASTPPVNGEQGNYLLNRTPGVALVALQQRYPQALDFLTSRVVQTAPMALQDGLRFHLYFSNGELHARAINQAKVVKRTTTVQRKPAVTPDDADDAQGNVPDTATDATRADESAGQSP